ncbi:RNA chaperone Hfq [Thermosipho atlanticus]|uniref:RNA-binding protein Hfq n=1 Tax=Thermosipho atlanticus DSM 15807 TaxID=1123380 RepID=A0A1M5SQU8_9BACT|nr:RNA chaperone Hfq [Thermosipho atlanticus]SHH40899.1 RNA-binding protein Hfq [Thermosipho atlanticus DSM 15807]
MAEKFNLQDRFLNILRTNKIPIKVYLVNGFQTKGIIRSFDSYTMLLENGDQQNLIYKHAISTIMPESFVKLIRTQSDENQGNNEKEIENNNE